MSTPIRLIACAKTFADGTRALEPLDLEIHAGETIVFLGPSGCGKTTTLRLIAGLEAPDAGGRVLFGDRDVTAVPIERRNVGMVFQSYALFPNMSVGENVAYGLKLRRMPMPERRERVAEMLRMMHIAELADRRIDQLSGGQRQRVALARALAVRPAVLLLDEPLTALDAKLRDGLRLEIDALLRGLGITAIYVTHDQAEAMALGDRIVVMSKGRVAQIGAPREIYFRPADPFVAAFIGTTNRLRGRIAAGRLELPGGSAAWSGPGGAVELMFRPHEAVIDGPVAHFRATVQAAHFLGDRTRVMLALADGQSAIVETEARRELAHGATVAVGLDPAHTITLPSPDPA